MVCAFAWLVASWIRTHRLSTRKRKRHNKIYGMFHVFDQGKNKNSFSKKDVLFSIHRGFRSSVSLLDLRWRQKEDSDSILVVVLYVDIVGLRVLFLCSKRNALAELIMNPAHTRKHDFNPSPNLIKVDEKLLFSKIGEEELAMAKFYKYRILYYCS